jgi:hypothetical protein
MALKGGKLLGQRERTVCMGTSRNAHDSFLLREEPGGGRTAGAAEDVPHSHDSGDGAEDDEKEPPRGDGGRRVKDGVSEQTGDYEGKSAATGRRSQDCLFARVKNIEARRDVLI